MRGAGECLFTLVSFPVPAQPRKVAIKVGGLGPELARQSQDDDDTVGISHGPQSRRRVVTAVRVMVSFSVLSPFEVEAEAAFGDGVVRLSALMLPAGGETIGSRHSGDQCA